MKLLHLLALASILLLAAMPAAFSPIPITQWESVPYSIGDEIWQVYYYDFFTTGCEVWRERYYPGYGWYRDGDPLVMGTGTVWDETWNTPRMACYGGSGYLVVSSADASKRLEPDPGDPCNDWHCAFYPQVFGGEGGE